MLFNIISNNYQESVKFIDELQKTASQIDGWLIDEQNPEVVFIIGGDGTFLKAVHKYNSHLSTIKFIPINFGGVGFYTNFNQEHEIKNLEQLFDETQYHLIELPLLETIVNDQHFYAINEVKLVNNLKPLSLEIFINDELLENFKGTGLAFSTASGSTGYTRSVGGSIIYPNLDLYQMVELAPVSTAIFRTINSPIIFSSHQKLLVNNLDVKHKPSTLVVDTFSIDQVVESLSLQVASFKLQLVSLKDNEINKTKFLHEIFVSK